MCGECNWPLVFKEKEYIKEYKKRRTFYARREVEFTKMEKTRPSPFPEVPIFNGPNKR